MLRCYMIIPPTLVPNNSFLVLQQKYRPHYTILVSPVNFSYETYRSDDNRDLRYNMQEALLTTTSREPNVSLRIILYCWYSWVAKSIDGKEMCHVLTLSIVDNGFNRYATVSLATFPRSIKVHLRGYDKIKYFLLSYGLKHFAQTIA